MLKCVNIILKRGRILIKSQKGFVTIISGKPR